MGHVLAARPAHLDGVRPAAWIELQRQRMAAGVTQEDLAHEAGLTRRHYQQIERRLWKPGQPANPSIKVLVRLCQVLQVEVSVILPKASQVDWPPG